MFQKVAGPFREFGPVAGLLYAVSRVLNGLSPRCNLHVYELTVQPITDKALAPERMRRNLEIREIRPGDPEIALMPVRPDAMAARIRQKALCLGAYRKGALIGYMWFASGEYEEDEVRCAYRLTPGDSSVFDFDLYLFPEHRMGLGFVALWSGANEFLFRRGIRYTYSRMSRFNLATRRAHKHLGCVVAARAMFLQLGPVEIMMATTRPFCGVSFGAGSRADFTLGPGALARRPAAGQD